jgi:hypothetical protein
MNDTTSNTSMGTTTVRLSRLPRDMASDTLALELLMASRGIADAVVVR